MTFDPNETHPLRKICQEWIGKVNQGIEHRKPWMEIAEQCEHFYSASVGFLWDGKTSKRFWDTDSGAVKPKFHLTVARAFEMVALFGPTLYWRNPVRTGEVRKPLEMDWQLYFQFLPPEAQQQLQFQFQQNPMLNPEYEDQLRQLRASIMSQYLNWTPDILNLHGHGELAVTQALVTGRGLLWTDSYRPPGSQRTMVGSFFDPVENFVVDPDATTMEDAYWIAKRCIEPVWKVERDRQHLGYTPGSLQQYATLESGDQQGANNADDLYGSHKASNKTQDMIVYWKIWTKCGIARLKESKSSGLYGGFDEDMRAKLEQVIGDYAYLEVVTKCPFLLNAPTAFLQQAQNEQVRQALSWPIPFWKRDKWPVNVLDFYCRPKKVWPIPPLAPGLGELIAINLLFSHRVSRLWMSQRDFIAYKKSISEELRKLIEEGNDLTFLPMEDIQGNIAECIQFLTQPNQKSDVGQVLDELAQAFDRRTGLTDLMYGQQDPQSRSATDVRIREKMTNIRPEFMASKVEEWQCGVAKSEAVAVKTVVGPQDVLDLFGPIGAWFWMAQISQQPDEKVLHEIDYRVEASSARRPSNDAKLANLTAFTQAFLPIIQQYSAQSMDVTPLQNMMTRWGKYADFDMRGIYIPTPPPPQPVPPPQQQPGAEQQAQQPQPQQVA